MNWLVFAISALMTTLIAIMMIVMPAITLRTVPLGVSVPQEHVDDTTVRSAVRQYRWWTVVAFVLSIAVAVGLSIVDTIAGAAIPPLLLLVLGYVVYLLSRHRIQRAKQAGGWYQGVPVRLSADIQPDAQSRAPVQPAWYFVGLVLLLIVAVVGVYVYPTLPNPLPIHWDSTGTANGFAEKSWFSVFGPLLIGIGSLVLLYVIALLVRLSPTRARGTDPARLKVQQRLMQGLLGQIALAATIEFGAITLAGWLTPGNGGLMTTLVTVLPVLLVVIILIFAFRYSRVTRRSTQTSENHETAQPDAPDDDRYWKGGGFYVNRNDPAIMVPKRFGIGWTFNFGHPAGLVFLAVIIAIVIIVPIVASHH